MPTYPIGQRYGVVAEEAVEIIFAPTIPSPTAISGSSVGAGVAEIVVEILFPQWKRQVYIAEVAVEYMFTLAEFTLTPVTPTGAQTASFAYVS